MRIRIFFFNRKATYKFSSLLSSVFRYQYTTLLISTLILKSLDTSITTKGDSVIIKAGGIEVVIDSKGLVVKGGEIKAE